MCEEHPAAGDGADLNDLLGGTDPYRVECSRFTPLVERLVSLPAEGAAPQPRTRPAEAPKVFLMMELFYVFESARSTCRVSHNFL